MLLLSVVLSYYLSSLYKLLLYFQARVEQSVPFHHLLSFSSYYGARPQTSRTGFPSDSRINVPSWMPRRHTSRLYPRHKQDQPITLLSRVSRSPSKLRLQAPTPESRTQCGARTSTTPLPISRSGKSQIHDKRATSLLCAHTQVCARDNRSVTCLETYATTGP